ncbi:MAG: hypothetical protein MHM6MM_005248 [Cercozoa sp. M6MM]
MAEILPEETGFAEFGVSLDTLERQVARVLHSMSTALQQEMHRGDGLEAQVVLLNAQLTEMRESAIEQQQRIQALLSRQRSREKDFLHQQEQKQQLEKERRQLKEQLKLKQEEQQRLQEELRRMQLQERRLQEDAAKQLQEMRQRLQQQEQDEQQRRLKQEQLRLENETREDETRRKQQELLRKQEDKLRKQEEQLCKQEEQLRKQERQLRKQDERCQNQDDQLRKQADQLRQQEEALQKHHQERVKEAVDISADFVRQFDAMAARQKSIAQRAKQLLQQTRTQRQRFCDSGILVSTVSVLQRRSREHTPSVDGEARKRRCVTSEHEKTPRETGNQGASDPHVDSNNDMHGDSQVPVHSGGDRNNADTPTQLRPQGNHNRPSRTSPTVMKSEDASVTVSVSSCSTF